MVLVVLTDWQIARLTQNTMKAKDPLLNKNLMLCCLLQFLFMTSFNLTVPIIALYVVSLGGSYSLAGLVAGLFALADIAFRPIAGDLTDHMDKKKLLAIGYAAVIIAFVGYALLPSIGCVALMRIVHAFGFSIQTTLLPVASMQFMPRDRIVEGTGYVGICATLGMAIGPSIGIMGSQFIGFMPTFLIGAGIMMLTFALVAIVPIDRKPAASGDKFTINSFIYLPFIALAFCTATFGFCSGNVNSFLALMCEERGIWGSSVFFVILSVFMVVTRPFIGRFIDRNGPGKIVPWSFVSEMTCMIIVAFAMSPYLIIVAAFFRGFGWGTGQVNILSYALKVCPDDKRGVVNSTLYMGIDVGQGFGAIAGGAIIGVAGYTTTFLVSAAVIVLGGIVYMLWTTKQKKKA